MRAGIQRRRLIWEPGTRRLFAIAFKLTEGLCCLLWFCVAMIGNMSAWDLGTVKVGEYVYAGKASGLNALL